MNQIQFTRMKTALLSLICLGLIGCGSSESTEATVSRSPSPKPQPPAVTPTAKIKFKDGAGETTFSIKFQPDGAKLVDGKEVELARYNFDGNKVKIKDPADNVLGYVVRAGNRYKLEDASQSKTLFKLQLQDDGDWKLEDGNEKTLYKIKKRDYGFELENVDDTSVSKVKLKDSKLSLRDANEETLYYTKDPLKPAAMACLGLDRVDSIPLQFAFMVSVNR